jgi:L-lysine 2,3-aminomutase
MNKKYTINTEVREALKLLQGNAKLSLNQIVLIKGFAKSFKRYKKLSERQMVILFELKKIVS